MILLGSFGGVQSNLICDSSVNKVKLFYGLEIWHGIFWGLNFVPGSFFGFLRSPRDFFAPISLSLSLEALKCINDYKL